MYDVQRPSRSPGTLLRFHVQVPTRFRYRFRMYLVAWNRNSGSLAVPNHEEGRTLEKEEERMIERRGHVVWVSLHGPIATEQLVRRA